MSPRRATRRRRFAINPAWVIPVLALATVALGVWAWRDRGYRLADALFRTTGLFDTASSMYDVPAPGATDWRFAVAVWTGFATLSATFFFTIFALLQARATHAAARWMRQRVIIVGGEGIASRGFEAAQRARKSVIWLGAPSLNAASTRAFAVPWPLEDHSAIIAQYAKAPDHILLAEEDDADALVLTRAARVVAPNAFITVLMRDVRLAEDAAATLNEARTRVLSVAEVAARALCIDHPPFLIAKEVGHKRIHALIVGFGQHGQAVASDIIVNCRTTYLGLPSITVIDPDAKALEGVLRVRAPEIDACAHFTFIEGRFGSHGVIPDATSLAHALAEAGPVTAAYVCLSVDAEALSTAGMLQSLLRAVDVGQPRIFVRLRESDTLEHTAGALQGLNALTAFGDLESVIEASEFLSNTPDSAARAFSAAYRAALPADERDDPKNRSARPWDELDESFRQSNRDAVAHIPAKLASAGIDPALWLGLAGPPKLAAGSCLFASDEDCEKLAELEHERWNTERRMDGWRSTTLRSKDELRRLHPSLVPYEALADDVKEYDRVIVRETQMICCGPKAT
ncbi:MAG TPA: RyR domain-containing protein [Caulobacteraceae bacterium]